MVKSSFHRKMYNIRLSAKKEEKKILSYHIMRSHWIDKYSKPKFLNDIIVCERWTV